MDSTRNTSVRFNRLLETRKLHLALMYCVTPLRHCLVGTTE